MGQNSKNYIVQYKVLFYLSWICLYIIFPAWISSHSILQAKGLSYLSDPFTRSLAILGLIIYFSISAYLINRSFRALILDQPVIIKTQNWLNIIKSHMWLVIVCFIAVILHVPSYFIAQVGYLHQGLWMYDFSNEYWHKLFDFPIQYGFWLFAVLLILIIKKKKTINVMSDYISEKFSIHKSNNLIKLLFIFTIFILFSIYSFSFPYSTQEALRLLRFPPVSKYLYLITYYAFGVSNIGPRIVQLLFYVLSAVYLYRTIHLFREKETALLGAAIYLFSPIIFFYASMTTLASGTVFFMILISFYFLRFLKYEEGRDIILTSYFIWAGFMYKRIVLVMFIICFAYLVLFRVNKKQWHSIIHFKILFLSLISVLPFYVIGRYSGLNFYAPIWSRLISFDSLMVFPLMIENQISLIVSCLFLIAVVFSLLTKRDNLSLFFGIFIIAYFFFITITKNAEFNHRYATAFYPAIAIFLAQLIFFTTKRIRWKHTFKMIFSAVNICLIVLCITPRSSSNLITFKYKDFEHQQYPFKKSADWISNMTKNDDRILFLPMPPAYYLYIERIYSDRDKINHERLVYFTPSMVKDIIYPTQKLKEFCYAENISYILFPFGPKNSFPDIGSSNEAKYLEAISDAAFIEVARFNLEDNYLIIYKIMK